MLRLALVEIVARDRVSASAARGFTGNGCVGDACSPGTSLFGTGRSSMSKIGLPVTRLSVNISPVLLTMMTAGTVVPSRLQVDEQRRRLGVVVPDVVMHELEVPEILAGVRIDRDDRRREQIVAGTIDADAVVVRGAERHVEDAALRIERHVAPDVDAGSVLRAVSAPGVVAELARAAARCGTSTPACRSAHPTRACRPRVRLRHSSRPALRRCPRR